MATVSSITFINKEFKVRNEMKKNIIFTLIAIVAIGACMYLDHEMALERDVNSETIMFCGSGSTSSHSLKKRVKMRHRQ